MVLFLLILYSVSAVSSSYVGNNVSAKAQIAVAVFGRITMRGMTSLSISEPVLQTAVEDIARKYSQTLSITYTRTLAHSCLLTCNDAADVLAQWYYRRENDGRAVVFVTPGDAAAGNK